MHSATPSDVRRARRLRTEATDAERHLWNRLRAQQIDGQRFRRQVPIGPYIADLVCLKGRLIIELDGSQHANDVARDSERTAWLASQGFRVLRFWDNEVLMETDGVVDWIHAALAEKG